MMYIVLLWIGRADHEVHFIYHYVRLNPEQCCLKNLWFHLESKKEKYKHDQSQSFSKSNNGTENGVIVGYQEKMSLCCYNEINIFAVNGSRGIYKRNFFRGILTLLAK